MKSKSINGASPIEIQFALADCIKDNFKPTLAIVFISVKQDRQAVVDLLMKHNIDVIGATSSGEFIDGHQSESEITILLLDISRNDYSILFEDIGDRGLEKATASLVDNAFQKFKDPAFILITTLIRSDGKLLDGEGMVKFIEKLAGPDITMFGGMAGDDLSFSGTWIFTHKKTTDYGIAALVLDETKIELHGLAFSGWKPMGVSRIATKSEGNLIYTIDDRPALEMYLHYLGHEVSSNDDQIDFFDQVGVHYPFQIERENREPKMCNPIGYDREKQALICESDVVQGSRLRFSTPPDFDIIETVISKASELKNDRQAEADALLIFSCAGRMSALGPMAQEENEGLAKVWNTPMAGFYTYGEYGKGLNGKHEFHSTTCSWVAIKEKS
ncbi:MAG: FIST C-terminal domain-containing protein [Bacteroidales bacterium]|nr:FIST C-terminal domain-containing protein [Bacteroidales bacterium]